MVKKKKAKTKVKKTKAEKSTTKKGSSKKITLEAKGKPVLRWIGKKPVNIVKSFPAQLVEVFDPEGKTTFQKNPSFSNLKKNWHNMIFHGDNSEVMGFLLLNGFRGKIDLICIDPPFASNANYIRKVELRGKSKSAKFDGEDYTIGEQIQYKDIWSNDSYLQFMYERLIMMGELLSENGTILVHLSSHRSHELKIMLDEIFPEKFKDEIIWVCGRTGSGHTSLPIAFNAILRYTKSEKFTYNKPTVLYTKEEIEKFEKDEKGYYYRRGQAQRELKEHEKEKYLKTYVDLKEGKTIDNVWDDVGTYSLGNEKVRYPTQKPEKLLKRLIEMASNKDDIVLDCFMGSSTTLVACQQGGRRWIGCDINKGAIQVSSKRIQNLNVDLLQENSLKQTKLIQKKNEYRKFRIRGFDSSNDTGALKEILERRFVHPEWRGPSFIVIDGGKAQKNAAEYVLKNLDLLCPSVASGEGGPIQVVAVVKDERHRPKNILGNKKLIRTFEKDILMANSEAHRFALSFHRDLQRRSMKR